MASAAATSALGEPLLEGAPPPPPPASAAPPPRSGWLRPLLTETLAGVTVGVLAVPQGLSFASVAGLPPVYGLYNSIAPALPYAVLGTSPHLVVGPTAVMSLVVRGAVPRTSPEGAPVEEASAEWIGYAVALSFVAGVVQALLGAAGLGVFLRLVSEPVMAGFVTASAILMMLSQASQLLGVHRCRASDLLGPGHDYDECFLQEYVASLLKQAHDVHLATTLLSLFALAFLAAFRFLAPPSRVLLSRSGPIALVALFVSVFLIIAHDAGTTVDENGREFDGRLHVRLVGHIPNAFPGLNAPFAGAPGGVYSNLQRLLPDGVVIALISFTEAMAMAATVARKTGLGKIDASRELVALGASNLACSVWSGYPVTGSFSRTAINADAGARYHQVANLISAAVVILTLLVLTPLVRYTPQFALAAVVFMSVVPLVDVKEALFLWRTSRLDFLAFSLVVVVTLVAGVVKGLAAGILVTWIGTLMHMPPPRISLLRFRGPAAAAVPNAAAATATITAATTTQAQASASPPASTATPRAPLVARGGDAFADAPTTDPRFPGKRLPRLDVMVVSLRSNLVFSSVEPFLLAVEEAERLFKPRLVLVEAHSVKHVDASGVHALMTLCEKRERLARSEAGSGNSRLLVLAGLTLEPMRALERARAADADFRDSFALAPVVGGVSPRTRLAAFTDVGEALGWVAAREVPALLEGGGSATAALAADAEAPGAAAERDAAAADERRFELDDEAVDMMETAKLEGWRATDPAPSGGFCRAPPWTKTSFEVVVAPAEWGVQRAVGG